MNTTYKTNKMYIGESHTFVVCAYQESRYLEACVQSLITQSVKSHICIATSTPNMLIQSISEKYNLPVYVNTEQLGIAEDWNFACRCAKTPLVTLAHQDDVYNNNYTEWVIDALNRCNHPLIAFTDYCEIRDDVTIETTALLKVKRLMLFPLRIKGLWKNKFIRRRILSIGSAICCPTVTMVLPNLKTPVFKNNMKSNIDWQAWEEISKIDGEYAYVSKTLVKHRIHGESTTSALLKVNGRKKEDLYMFYKFWPKPIAHIIDWFYQVNEKLNK